MKSRAEPALRDVPAATVQLSLPVQGVLKDVQSAFYGLCIQAGRQVLAGMMEADRVALCGPKGVPHADRRAVRGGTTRSAVVLGGQRIAGAASTCASGGRGRTGVADVRLGGRRRPARCGHDGGDVSGRVDATLSHTTLEPLPASERAMLASKSVTSRRFVALSEQQLEEWLSRPLGELDLPVVMIDGIHFRDRVILVSLGIDTRGNKHILGLREGSTETTRMVRSLLSDLVERGLDADRARLWVIDGGKALRKAIVECFGGNAIVQRCQEHKRRNVIERLPEELRAGVGRAMRDTWDGADAGSAKKQLQRLASSLRRQHPRGRGQHARRSRGDTDRTGPGHHWRAVPHLRTTNPIENLNGSIAHYARNVMRWRDGQMTLRWGGQCPQRREGSIPQASRASRHEDARRRVGQARHDRQPAQLKAA
jgi:hypothetical protein